MMTFKEDSYNLKIKDLTDEITVTQAKLSAANSGKNRLKETLENVDGFENLKDQVQKLEALLRLNAHADFSDNQITLIREVFGLDVNDISKMQN